MKRFSTVKGEGSNFSTKKGKLSERIAVFEWNLNKEVFVAKFHSKEKKKIAAGNGMFFLLNLKVLQLCNRV